VSWLGSSALSQLEDSVRVIVRVRPLLPREIKEGCTLSPSRRERTELPPRRFAVSASLSPATVG
jgi:hypothetical protein